MQIKVLTDHRGWTVGVRWATYGNAAVLVDGVTSVRSYVWVHVGPVTVRVRCTPKGG